MQWAWMNKINYKSVMVILLFSLMFFATRVPRLWNDTINPDAVNWHYRSEQFINGLKYHQWEKTYQHYHPGITLMWIAGVSTELYKQFSGIKTYTIYTFQTFDFISKFAIISTQLILTIYIIFVLRKFFGTKGSVLVAGIFTFEPFFLGNSRLYHLDILFALFVFAALLTGYLAVKRESILYYVATGILLAMSFLTKSVGVLAIGYYLGWLVLIAFKSKSKVILFHAFLVASVVIATTFLVFPAMWVKPVYYISQIFTESERIGLRRGHDQIVFGSPTNEASILFYPLIFVLKTSPFMLVGIVLFALYAYRLKKKYTEQINHGFVIYLIIFILLYIIFMSLASKKVDRYITLIYPFTAVICYYGYKALTKIEYFNKIIALMVVGFILYPIVKLYPYYFTYTNPLMGTAEKANMVVGQKPFGIGVYDLRDLITHKYGDAKLGFLDPKPMKEIYGNSKVMDIRISGVSDYDLLILGINENMPDNILKSDIKFVESSNLVINGLNYWRIYEKHR